MDNDLYEQVLKAIKIGYANGDGKLEDFQNEPDDPLLIYLNGEQFSRIRQGDGYDEAVRIGIDAGFHAVVNLLKIDSASISESKT